MEKKTIGKFIAVLRKANGMTQKELGDKLLVSDKTISRWECDESLPDLSLIPAIAEIFDITADELLRGERNTTQNTSSNDETKSKVKSDKQFRYMIHKKYQQYKNRSVIACSVMAIGILIAAICDICFTRGILGFLLGTIFIVIAVVLQHAGYTDYVLFIDEEDSHVEESEAYNQKLKSKNTLIYFIALEAFAFLLPLGLFNMAYTGIDTAAWIVLGFIFSLATLFITYTIYLFKFKPKTPDREKQTRLFKKVFKVVGFMILPTLVALVIINSFGYYWFAKYEVFDSYDAFEKYAEELTFKEYFGDMDPAALAEEDWEYFESVAEMDEIVGPNGEVLCEYRTDNNAFSVINFDFDNSENGLPIKVLTRQGSIETYNRVSLISGLFIMLIATEILAGAGYYVYKLRKIN